MSDQIVRMVNDTKETDSHFMQSYQSVWMSRWKRTSCKSTTQAHHGSSNTVQKMELDHTVGENCADKMNVSRFVARHEEIINTTFEIVNKSLRMSSESLRKEGMEFQKLPTVPPSNCGSGFLFKLGQDTDGVETSRYRDESTSKNPPKWTQCLPSAKDSTSAVSKSMWESFVKPSSAADPFIFERPQFESDEGKTSSDASEKTEVKKSLYDCHSQQKVPECTHDMETMRICSSVDSVVDPGGGCPRFCQATHSLLITNLEDNVFGSKRMSGDTHCDLCNLSPFYGQGKRGLNIQSPSNVTISERTGNYVRDSEVTAKNGSSVQEKDPLSGAISAPSKKAIYMDFNSSCQASDASSKQGEDKRPNTVLPDINLNLRPLPATVTSSENGDPLSSRTQSLKMDILLAHNKQSKQQSIPCLDNSPVANPGNRFVKRLKLSSSLSLAQGTKSSSKDEPAFQDKLNKNFGTIAVICSEPTLAKAQGKDQYFPVNPPEKDQELLLSHAWIKRWQRHGSSSTKNESSTVVFCDPRSSNLTLKGLQNEQYFPSIAAMALMGRAMSGFQPCQPQKRGSLTVWNSRAL